MKLLEAQYVFKQRRLKLKGCGRIEKKSAIYKVNEELG